jgi:RNA polymerase sigma-70 factor (sigma-E family)
MRSLDGVTTFRSRHLNKHRETPECARATYRAGGCLISVKTVDDTDADKSGAEAAVAGLFAARYPELVRLAGLLGADDPEDIAQEAFARLLQSYGSLRDASAALAYVRATVCNLTRNRRRHLRVSRLRAPAERPADVASSEQAMLLREEQREVVAALAALPARRREAIVLRYWLGLSVAEIAAAMGISAGTVKSQVSRGLATLGQALEEGR